jgi:peptidoglycan hydrolase-like protein with peptidoglycan-binding domain
MGTMLDTVNDPRQTFSGLKVEAVAAYGNGKYANFNAAKSEFPHVHVLEIDVNGQGIGNAGDFEAGDMPSARAGSWAKGRIDAGIRRPVLYFSVSSWQAIMRSLGDAGLARSDVRIWTAHYNGKPHLCSAACGFGVKGSADATQWGSSDAPGTLHPPFAGRNIDVSMTAEHFFAGAPKPASTPPFPGRNLHQPPAMSGDDVRTWQAQMAHRGWSIAVNGAYDAASEHICRQFQEEKGLGVNGVVDATTWHATWAAPVT